jgi:acetate CoA/acetoacetate CoA-transferase alpha subunit
MATLITAGEAATMVPDGATVMFGGFMGCGNPFSIVDALLKHGTSDITLIANDCAFPDVGIGKLVIEKRVRKVIASHVGLNPAVAEQMNQGTLEAELIPQGTLAERIRSAGAGIGGFLTPTGVGTPVEEGKEKIVINGKAYLLELPLFADVALVKAWKADAAGNLVFRRSARNFNPLIATAAKLVIAEAEHIVPVGEIDPDQVHTPAIFVDYLVRSEEESHGR